MNAAKPIPKRRWRFLRFSLRGMLLAVTLGCLALGYQVQRARSQRAAVRALVAQGAAVMYDFEFDDHGYHYSEPSTPKWLLDMLGVDFFHRVEYVSIGGRVWKSQEEGIPQPIRWEEESPPFCRVGYLGCAGWMPVPEHPDLTHLLSLRGLKRLDIRATNVSDLEMVSRLTSLEYLNASCTPVESIEPLRRLTRLKTLNLAGTNVADLSALSQLERLDSLEIGGTKVEDVAPLGNLSRLRVLRASETNVKNVAPLAGLANLKGVFLCETRVHDVTPLAKLQRLEVLWLQETSVTDVTALADLSHLRSLNLSGTRVRNLPSLKNWRDPLELILNKCRDLTPAGLAPLYQVETIMNVDLYDCGFSREDVEEIQRSLHASVVDVNWEHSSTIDLTRLPYHRVVHELTQ